jgi:transcriptional regulator with XRE-family HTH domain
MSHRTLGDVIRAQRELQKVSLRQLAQMAGISNPYLSQIERGLRDPSEDVVSAIASTLDLSSKALYEAAGIQELPEDGDAASEVEAAIEADTRLKPAQRRALLETYHAFVAANGGPRQRPRPTRRRANQSPTPDPSA